jgi:hypothetical protein
MVALMLAGKMGDEVRRTAGDFAGSKARVFSAYLNITSPEVSNFSIFPLPR